MKTTVSDECFLSIKYDKIVSIQTYHECIIFFFLLIFDNDYIEIMNIINVKYQTQSIFIQKKNKQNKLKRNKTRNQMCNASAFFV